jgi:hypothetical protein
MIDYKSSPDSPVIEVRASGKITDGELRACLDRIGPDLDAGKTRVLEIIEHFTGMEAAALATDLKSGVPLAQKVTRVAVVADQSWVRGATHLGALFTRADLKVFKPEQLAEARSWIAAD